MCSALIHAQLVNTGGEEIVTRFTGGIGLSPQSADHLALPGLSVSTSPPDAGFLDLFRVFARLLPGHVHLYPFFAEFPACFDRLF